LGTGFERRLWQSPQVQREKDRESALSMKTPHTTRLGGLATRLCPVTCALAWIAWALAVAGGALGAGGSCQFDLPTGGAIVCASGPLLGFVQALGVLHLRASPLTKAKSLWPMTHTVASEPR
jgi:hypothetical protein